MQAIANGMAYMVLTTMALSIHSSSIDWFHCHCCCCCCWRPAVGRGLVFASKIQLHLPRDNDNITAAGWFLGEDFATDFPSFRVEGPSLIIAPETRIMVTAAVCYSWKKILQPLFASSKIQYIDQETMTMSVSWDIIYAVCLYNNCFFLPQLELLTFLLRRRCMH
jgi:hypothetical protein